MTAPSLDRSTGLVLGLATTAMPFAGSADEQAERWLRLLRSYGSAALVLAALGIREHPLEAEPQRVEAPVGESEDTAGRVAEQARREAAGRGAQRVETTDVLAGVLTVYGRAFERVLHRHGCEAWQLRQLLELERAEPA